MRYGFVIDHRRCIGCHACTVACKEENRVPLGAFRTWVKYVEKGTFPDTRRYFSVLRCNHCDDAPCVTICPTVALYRRDDGIVDFDGRRCIGCKCCMQACPYDRLYMTPDTSTAAKCNYCAHRIEVGLEPACVIVCPERAIIAGDLDDPRTDIARLVAREPVEVRKPEQGTRPKVYYVGADVVHLGPRPLLRLADLDRLAGDQARDVRARIIEVAGGDGALGGPDHAGRLQSHLDAMRAVVALGGGAGVGVNVERVVRAGLHAGLAADTSAAVEVYDAVVAPVERHRRADGDARGVVAVVAAQHGEVAPRVGKRPLLHVLHPGAEGAQRHP